MNINHKGPKDHKEEIKKIWTGLEDAFFERVILDTFAVI